MASKLCPNELELYRLLEKANLLQYFTNFLAKGGDDVTQLSEASKEEFDEIIDLVGLKQKPLHIRRLQKALRDWAKGDWGAQDNGGVMSMDIAVPQSALMYLKVNQSLLLTPSLTGPQHKMQFTIKGSSSCAGGGGCGGPEMPKVSSNGHANGGGATVASSSEDMSSNIFMSQPLLALGDETDSGNMDRFGTGGLMNLPPLFGTNSMFSGITSSLLNGSGSTPGVTPTGPSRNAAGQFISTPSASGAGIPVSLLPNAVLSSTEKLRIKMAAENLAHTLPRIDARINSTGRKDVNKGVMNVLAMAHDDPERETQIYRYSAIYGRFNAPRRTGKPMNHHEVSVNEAAGQLCLQIPELITRRDNLFHLARQVVKMAEEIPSSQAAVAAAESLFSSSVTGSATASPFFLLNSRNQSSSGPVQNLEEFEHQIEMVKTEIESLLEQEGRIRENYREAKQSNQGIVMNEMQKRLDDILNQLNNKFTEQTTLATRRMVILDSACCGPVAHPTMQVITTEFKLPSDDKHDDDNGGVEDEEDEEEEAETEADEEESQLPPLQLVRSPEFPPPAPADVVNTFLAAPYVLHMSEQQIEPGSGEFSPTAQSDKPCRSLDSSPHNPVST